jgi:hypothetical protein
VSISIPTEYRDTFSVPGSGLTLFYFAYFLRAEQPWRISLWYMFNGVGTAFGGLLGFAIGHLKGSLTSWRYEYVAFSTR